jgi:uncharacterized protein (TIGR00251 family)
MKKAIEVIRSPIQWKKDGVLVNILAKPGSRQSRIVGVDAEAISVQIAAPARDDKANTALVHYMAEARPP